MCGHIKKKLTSTVNYIDSLKSQDNILGKIYGLKHLYR